MPNNTALPYDLNEFATRHGLTLAVASIVLRANRRSKEMADLGAEILKTTAQLRRQKSAPGQAE